MSNQKHLLMPLHPKGDLKEKGDVYKMGSEKIKAASASKMSADDAAEVGSRLYASALEGKERKTAMKEAALANQGSGLALYRKASGELRAKAPESGEKVDEAYDRKPSRTIPLDEFKAIGERMTKAPDKPGPGAPDGKPPSSIFGWPSEQDPPKWKSDGTTLSKTPAEQATKAETLMGGETPFK